MRAPDEPYAIVAIAASAGGVTALSRVLGALPAGFPVPVLIVQHLDPRHQTVLAEVLGRRAKLPVRLANEGGRVEPGNVFIAPPDRHLLVSGGGRLTLCTSAAS